MKIIEFIKLHIKEVKLASITFVITYAICLFIFSLINNPTINTTQQKPSSQTTITYVGSKNSNKYHLPSCKWAENIKKSNKITFSSESKAKSKGYSPCKTCIN